MQVPPKPLVSGKVLRVARLLACLLLAFDLSAAQDKSRAETVRAIREAAFENSQIMEMIGYLTDVSGPRLTGSPNLKVAEGYTLQKLRQWGVANAHLEP